MLRIRVIKSSIEMLEVSFDGGGASGKRPLLGSFMRTGMPRRRHWIEAGRWRFWESFSHY
jgi:hypothetical protein